jgi:hypothetical protein
MVGLDVGLFVGELVGGFVGLYDGSSDFFTVGEMEGACDGKVDGTVRNAFDQVNAVISLPYDELETLTFCCCVFYKQVILVKVKQCSHLFIMSE